MAKAACLFEQTYSVISFGLSAKDGRIALVDSRHVGVFKQKTPQRVHGLCRAQTNGFDVVVDGQLREFLGGFECRISLHAGRF